MRTYSQGKRAIAMMRKSVRNAAGLAAGLALVAGLAGCRVNVEKGANGEDKNVQVDTPFGGIHVHTDQTTAADLGLPVYPGAQQVKDDDKHKSADVQMAFGEWGLRVRAVSYATAGTQEQVTAFYKKALGRYGDVITCQGNAPVGAPAMTTEGLTCEDTKNPKVQINHGEYGLSEDSLVLKAGSKRHQHIVGFEDSRDGKTRFALVALDLPAGVEKSSDQSD
ncbi:MAG: hypothetical protein ABR924_05785 [Terracidiphilus sp.]|jgi:hypothetical protein